MKANTGIIVKKANSFLVLDTIRKNGLITIEGIISTTGLSRPTVLTILHGLENREIISKAGYAFAEVGRQPALYAINVDAHFAIGIDIDGPPVHLAVSNLNGDLLYSASWENDFDDSLDKIANDLVQQIDLATSTLKISTKQILGIGLGLPASVDINANRAFNLSRLTALKDAPIDQIISAATGLDVIVRNDAHLSCLAEKKNLNNIDDMLYIVHRTGIGLAILLDGKVYEGQTGNAGFIGHTTTDLHGRKCSCGSNGCLEALSSKRAIREIYHEHTGIWLTYQEILKEADNGNKAAVDIFKEAGEFFGLGIANLIKIMDIYTVVIGDLGCDERHIFVKSINKSVKFHLATFLKKQPKIIVGKLKDVEFALGGCNFVIENFFVTPELKLKA